MSDYEPKKKKNSVKLYYNRIKSALRQLNNDEKLVGELFIDIFNYEMYDKEPDSFSTCKVEAQFFNFTDSLDELKEAYIEQCERNSENRNKGMTGTNGTTGTTGTYKDKDKDKGKGKEREREEHAGNISQVVDSIISDIEHNVEAQHE